MNSKWSYKLVRIAGIDVSVHITFFLLLLWFGVLGWQQSQTVAGVLTSISFIIVLFTCVVMHEFGHALTARRFGIKTRGITLLPIGGVAALERMPEDPKQEILVALAGPAVNVAIAALLFLFLSNSPMALTAEDIAAGNIPFLYQIMIINIVLAVFNMLPAFPMDGGRVLRASFALFMSHNDATQKAAKIGQAFAFVLMIIGVLYNPWLILIGVFVWFAATAEASMEQIQTNLLDITAEQAMITDFQNLDSHDALQKAIDLTLQTSQKDFPVLAQGEARFVLSQNALLLALQQHSPHKPLDELQLPEIHSVDSTALVKDLLSELHSSNQPLVSVTKNGRMVGIINLDNILELIKIQNALKTFKK